MLKTKEKAVSYAPFDPFLVGKDTHYKPFDLFLAQPSNRSGRKIDV